MRATLNTMKMEVPFEYERVQRMDALFTGSPLTDGKLPTFIMPPVDTLTGQAPSWTGEFLVNVDQWGNIIKEYSITPAKLHSTSRGNKAIIYNPAIEDFFEFLESQGEYPPCGLYYYKILVQNTFTFKTEIFYIDRFLAKKQQSKLGDFSPADFNHDFFTINP